MNPNPRSSQENPQFQAQKSLPVSGPLPRRDFFRRMGGLTAAALGIVSGFRPELLVLLLPLSTSTLIVTRRRVSEVVFAISILVISTGTWVGVLSLSVGGLVPLASLMLEYLALRSQYSLLFIRRNRPRGCETSFTHCRMGSGTGSRLDMVDTSNMAPSHDLILSQSPAISLRVGVASSGVLRAYPH